MKPFAILSILINCQLPACILSRSWTEIEPHHGLSVVDWNSVAAQSEEDPFSIPESRAESPTLMPTVLSSPTSKPSTGQTGRPTSSPTDMPIAPPTAAPVSPAPVSPAPVTPAPVAPGPNVTGYPEVPPPPHPGEGYFNYDHRPTNKYGPGQEQVIYYNSTYTQYIYIGNGWANVSTRAYNYWNEFGNNGTGPWQGELAEHFPEENKCANIGNQSPIDLRVTAGAICFEGHQIRVRTGDLHLTDDEEIHKLIEGNKLRLKYQRRPCSDLGNPTCAEPDPALADFPNNWPGLVDLLHIDFKVPSEHTVNGKRFDGEMQMFYLHPGRHRTPVVSVLMKVTKLGFNIELQRALDQFQITYDKDMAACEEFKRNSTPVSQEPFGNFSIRGRHLGSDDHDDSLTGTDLAESGHSFGDRILQALLGRRLGSDDHDDTLSGAVLAESGRSFGVRILQAILGRKLGSDDHDDSLSGTDLSESGHSFGDRILQANETNKANKTDEVAVPTVAPTEKLPTNAPGAEPTKAPAATNNQGNETIGLVNETIRTVWNPGHPLLHPGIYFYGYEGSLTEPPCSEFVSWKIMDTPMKMSLEQLEQMKRLIFTHRSPKCKFTSRHYRESVARPIQDVGNRSVWHCTSSDFAPDPK